MSEEKFSLRGRTLLPGKVISNFGQSSIDCVVRRISDHGATINVESALGIPQHFHLLISGEGAPRPCKLMWQSGKELGLEFEVVEATKDEPAAAPERRSSDSILRGQTLALRSALDEIRDGVVLLDSDMRAQFINRAFRKMWDLPDTVADRKPAFVALMYHGRDTHAYQVADAEIDTYVAERIRLVRSGDMAPVVMRRSKGDVLQMQCAVLPDGGRMLTYTDVTELVRRADELEALLTALDHISDGVLLLDADLKAQFLNQKMREYWGVTNERIETHPSYLELISNAPHAHAYGVSPDQLEAVFAGRVEAARTATPAVRDAHTPDGRHIRVHTSVTANGGRMLTYCDVTDLIKNAEQLEKLATIDSMTNLYNRRHFMISAQAEWNRFQRYQRPLSLLAIDIDHFKSVNDRYGHAVGDEAMIAVAAACLLGKRASDIVGRLGGEEFAMLLPETDMAQAEIVAERIREQIARHSMTVHKVRFNVTISVGIAAATISMSGIDALLRCADDALYGAKDAGRNCVIKYVPPPEARLAAE